MSDSIRQQIVISGVGGQGVLFVTQLLAEAAIHKGLAVLTSETHGMAQRGGTVLSHFKVGGFSSPLIRPNQADGLLVLKDENLAQHGAFLKKGGWAVVNSPKDLQAESEVEAAWIDADTLARQIENAKSVNLIMLGYALAQAEQAGAHQNRLFCSLTEIQEVLEKRFGGKPKMREASMRALETGYAACRK
ncbi:MAG: 2-oxoacid:acceptor oxidoreductase family protein [Desulfobacterales bacterium]|nr:MAG: 2-oxoacid:acceptor oxidoreductase family protein [Desulfobacterales bacterium]